MEDALQNILGLLVIIITAVCFCNKIYTRKEQEKFERSLVFDDINTKSIALLRVVESIAEKGKFKGFEEYEKFVYKNLKMLILEYHNDYKGIGFGRLDGFEALETKLSEELKSINKLLQSLIVRLIQTKYKRKSNKVSKGKVYTLLHAKYS